MTDIEIIARYLNLSTMDDDARAAFFRLARFEGVAPEPKAVPPAVRPPMAPTAPEVVVRRLADVPSPPTRTPTTEQVRNATAKTPVPTPVAFKNNVQLPPRMYNWFASHETATCKDLVAAGIYTSQSCHAALAAQVSIGRLVKIGPSTFRVK